MSSHYIISHYYFQSNNNKIESMKVYRSTHERSFFLVLALAGRLYTCLSLGRCRTKKPFGRMGALSIFSSSSRPLFFFLFLSLSLFNPFFFFFSSLQVLCEESWEGTNPGVWRSTCSIQVHTVNSDASSLTPSSVVNNQRSFLSISFFF